MSPLTASLPTAELEEWRYSRAGDLDLGRYTVVDAPATGTAPAGALVALRAMFPAPSTVVSLSEGRVTGIEFDPHRRLGRPEHRDRGARSHQAVVVGAVARRL